MFSYCDLGADFHIVLHQRFSHRPRWSSSLVSARRCLREPISEIFQAAELLRSAVDAHLNDDHQRASALFRAADLPEVRAWTESIWGKQTADIHRVRLYADAPPSLPGDQRVEARMPSAEMQAALIAHYGYRCAFCGIPLVRKSVRVRIARKYPEAVSWGTTNLSQHAAFQAMWLQFDHVLPHARGGDNSFNNLLVTCAPCNFGRGNYTLEELDLEDPRQRPIEKIDWDGLEQFQ